MYYRINNSNFFIYNSLMWIKISCNYYVNILTNRNNFWTSTCNRQSWYLVIIPTKIYKVSTTFMVNSYYTDYFYNKAKNIFTCNQLTNVKCIPLTSFLLVICQQKTNVMFLIINILIQLFFLSLNNLITIVWSIDFSTYALLIWNYCNWRILIL